MITKLSKEDYGVSPGSLRDHNLALIARTVVCSPYPQTRAHLARSLRLNRSTVTRLVDFLTEMGIVREDSARILGNGRPSIPLVPFPRTHVAIGISISSDFVSACVMDLYGESLLDFFQEVDVLAFDQKEFGDFVSDCLQSLCDQISDAKLHLAGISCGIPGLVSSDASRLIFSPTLQIRNIDLKALIRAWYQGEQVPIFFANSAQLGAIAEDIERNRAKQSVGDFIYISGAQGIGSALFRGGKLQVGSHGWAGEIGHITVVEDGERCSCGATGCLETVAGKNIILENAGFTTNAPISRLVADLKRNKSQVCEATERAAKYLGIALSAYINMVDVDDIIIGGHLQELLPFIDERILYEIESRTLSSSWNTVEIHPSIVKGQATVRGGAWRALLTMLDSPDKWTKPDESTLKAQPLRETPETNVE